MVKTHPAALLRDFLCRQQAIYIQYFSVHLDVDNLAWASTKRHDHQRKSSTRVGDGVGIYRPQTELHPSAFSLGRGVRKPYSRARAPPYESNVEPHLVPYCLTYTVLSQLGIFSESRNHTHMNERRKLLCVPVLHVSTSRVLWSWPGPRRISDATLS
jgi:hypothetical protein